MKVKRFIIALILLAACNCFAENIDPHNDGSHYGWGENVGWLNFDPNTGDGVQVASDKLTGYIWAENIGWINLSCENRDYCATVDFGVVNDGNGNLTGYGWGENVGWINFGPTNGGVSIDPAGSFSGWAWGENIGWINFGLAENSVLACKVTFEDLANFADDWLDSGSIPGNLDSTGNVDLSDYRIFASYWRDYCPQDWPLK